MKAEQQRGVTMIELMVAVAIVAILAAIAYPFYNDFVRRAWRADGIRALEAMANNQEKWRISNTTYTSTLGNIWDGGKGGANSSTDGKYTLGVQNNSATAYQLLATPSGWTDGDCGILCRNQNGPLGANCAANPTAVYLRDCWRR